MRIMKKKEKLWLLLKQIPRGKVTTYKILADKLGTHPRAVGRMLNSNPHLVIVPCHRVVRSDGGIGGYRFGIRKKSALLKKEGIKITKGKIYLKRFLSGFEGFGKL